MFAYLETYRDSLDAGREREEAEELIRYYRDNEGGKVEELYGEILTAAKVPKRSTIGMKNLYEKSC